METLNMLTNPADKRRYKRELYNLPVEFSLNTIEFHQLKKISTNGIAVDISKGGIGLLTEFPIEAGHVLIFKDEKNPIPPSVGVVKWAATNMPYTRGGIEFYGTYEGLPLSGF